MPGQATETAGVYVFEPSGKACTLSVYEKYPELCQAIKIKEKEIEEGVVV